MEDIYYYVPSSQRSQQVPPKLQPLTHSNNQLQQPQSQPNQMLTYYSPMSNVMILPQQQDFTSQFRNSQSHPQLYHYPQLAYNNQMINPRYTNSNVSVYNPMIAQSQMIKDIQQPLNNSPDRIHHTTGGTYNDENISPTTVLQNNIPIVTLPPLSSLVSQIKPTSQSCPDISTLMSESKSSITTMNANNIKDFTPTIASNSSSSPSSSGITNNSQINQRNCIPYILTSTVQPNLQNVNNNNNNNNNNNSEINLSLNLKNQNYPSLNPNLLIKRSSPPNFTTFSPKQEEAIKLKQVSPTIMPTKMSNDNLQNLIFKNEINVMELTGNKQIKRKSPSQQRKQCPICGKICSRPSTLKTHFLIHTGDNPFKCSWIGCKKSFNVKSNMLRHLKSHQHKLEKLAKKQADLLNKQKSKSLESTKGKKVTKKV